MTQAERAEKIRSILSRQFSQARTALEFSNPLQILVATILSAQCTDKRVNLVTAVLFKKYRTVRDFAQADLKVFEKDIHSTGFYRQKARNIITACGIIEKEFSGRVPDSMEELVTLPGVARKTANIVLLNGFGIIAGIAVDTHVKRLSRRLGLTRHEDPDKIEKDLMKILPKKKWVRMSDLLIEHGRSTCHARKPRCEKCVLGVVCPSQGKV